MATWTQLFLFLFALESSSPLWSSLSILGAADRAEMADIEQMKKFVPLITCEISSGQNVGELMFGVRVKDCIVVFKSILRFLRNCFISVVGQVLPVAVSINPPKYASCSRA